jgi:hypothetical protein
VVAGWWAFGCSLVGFISLVGQVYPLFGYLASADGGGAAGWVRRGKAVEAAVA